jgi:hypothetical protein
VAFLFVGDEDFEPPPDADFRTDLQIITEYAQHCGHLDLLREGVDGATGA